MHTPRPARCAARKHEYPRERRSTLFCCIRGTIVHVGRTTGLCAWLRPMAAAHGATCAVVSKEPASAQALPGARRTVWEYKCILRPRSICAASGSSPRTAQVQRTRLGRRQPVARVATSSCAMLLQALGAIQCAAQLAGIVMGASGLQAICRVCDSSPGRVQALRFRPLLPPPLLPPTTSLLHCCKGRPPSNHAPALLTDGAQWDRSLHLGKNSAEVKACVHAHVWS